MVKQKFKMYKEKNIKELQEVMKLRTKLTQKFFQSSEDLKAFDWMEEELTLTVWDNIEKEIELVKKNNQIEKMKDVLRFYSKERNWVESTEEYVLMDNEPRKHKGPPKVIEDGGGKAKEMLEEVSSDYEDRMYEQEQERLEESEFMSKIKMEAEKIATDLSLDYTGKMIEFFAEGNRKDLKVRDGFMSEAKLEYDNKGMEEQYENLETMYNSGKIINSLRIQKEKDMKYNKRIRNKIKNTMNILYEKIRKG